ncbi:O-antigen ligase family protein [Gottfriedia sp. NPDC057991]|uniref:O-antigen ligase family protein n=1 Tax=Gottfriedia sp. NPDC057991 TaxID=3346298 RepID=UPI0036DF1AD1
MKKNIITGYFYIIGIVIMMISINLLEKYSNIFILTLLILGFFVFLFGFIYSDTRKFDIIILLVLATDCFYFPIGNASYLDLLDLFTVLLLFKLFFYKRKATNLTYKMILLSLIALAFISSINATFEFSQSYLDSIIPFRHYVVLLLFFPIVDWLDRGYELNKYLVMVSFIALSLFIVQYFLYTKIVFLSIPGVSVRIGLYRLHFQTLTPILGAMVAFNSFMFTKKGLYKWFSLLVYVMALFFTIFVNQTRTYMFGLILSGLIMFIISRTNIISKSKISITLSLLLVILFPLYFGPVSDLVKTAFSDITTSSETYGIRQNAMKYYIELGKEHSITGYGLINLRTKSDWLLPGYSMGYYWVDIGIYGLFFLHGILGVIWYFLVLYLLLKDTKRLINSNYVYILAYASFGVLTITTIGPFYFYLFPTVFCIAITQYINRKNIN